MFKAEAADQVSIFVEPGHPVDGVVYLAHGKDPARHGQTEELHFGHGFVAIFIPALTQGPPFHAADAAGDIEGCCQGSGGVFILGDMGNEAGSV